MTDFSYFGYGTVGRLLNLLRRNLLSCFLGERERKGTELQETKVFYLPRSGTLIRKITKEKKRFLL